MTYLPPEIWFMIARLLDSQEDLSRLCKVSKTLNEVATPILYENPDTIYITSSTTQEFFRTLIESPHLAWQVKHLDIGFDDFSIEWKDLCPATKDLFSHHVVTLLRLKSSLMYGTARDGVDVFLEEVGSSEIDVPQAFCQSVLLSLLPNLREAQFWLPDETFLPTTTPGALSRLQKAVFRDMGHDPFDFENLAFFAKAATNLDSLSFERVPFHFGSSLDIRRQKFPSRAEPVFFPGVANLNLGGYNFQNLEKSAVSLVLRFPLLRSFRFQQDQQVDNPSLPETTSLLRALHHYASRLKHLSLCGAINIEEKDDSDDSDDSEDSAKTSAWPKALKVLSRLSLETLSIEDISLWPFAVENPRPRSILVDYMPQSLRHLHLERLGTKPHDAVASILSLTNIQACFYKLAEAIAEDGMFSRLELVTFTSKFKDEDLSGAMEALKKAGVSMVRQDGPWDSDGLYAGK